MAYSKSTNVIEGSTARRAHPTLGQRGDRGPRDALTLTLTLTLTLALTLTLTSSGSPHPHPNPNPHPSPNPSFLRKHAAKLSDGLKVVKLMLAIGGCSGLPGPWFDLWG